MTGTDVEEAVVWDRKDPETAEELIRCKEGRRCRTRSGAGDEPFDGSRNPQAKETCEGRERSLSTGPAG